MHGLQYYETLLFLLQALALVGVLIRILISGLDRVYKFFFWYLIAQCAQLLVPAFAHFGTDLYGYLYLTTEGAIVVLYALVVLELYSLVFHNHSGIATTARRYVVRAVAAAIILSLLLLEIERVPAQLLSYFYTFERTIVASLVFFVFLITLFLVRYPIPLNRNVIYYSIGYAVYFSTKAVGLLLRNTGRESDRAASMALLCGSIACLVFWIFALKSSGEEHQMVLNPRWSPEDEKRLLQQLDAINDTLLRARK